MVSSIKNLPVKSVCASAIILLIGFQQFPIIKAGGSFKIYEVLAIVILLVDLIKIREVKLAGFTSLAAFGFFVVSPIISYVWANVCLSYPNGFYLKYSEVADSFKFNYNVFPFLLLIYMVFNFCAFNEISKSSFISKNFEKLLKTSVYIGTGIAIYSILTMFTVDLVAKLPSFIQAKHEYNFRSAGLSQEPSFYVLYQTWICLILYYTKKKFKAKVWYLLMAINVLSLLFTFSSMLLSLAAIILFNVFFLKSSVKAKIVSIATLLFAILAIFAIIDYYNYYDAFMYTFGAKVYSFISSPAYTTDSGSFRSYTTGIGFKIFKDNWFAGVGVGNSIYYMYIHEFTMGIEIFGERLFPGSFPQNLFAMVLSEQGVIGAMALLALIVSAFKMFWKARYRNAYGLLFLNGLLFNIGAMLTIAPTYSMFIWVFIAFGINYTRKNLGMVLLDESLETVA
jgi:O-antigen ligase